MGFDTMKNNLALLAAGGAGQGASIPRYALYYAPPAESALWRFGCDVLGYDAECGADTPPLALPGLEPGLWQEMRRKPAGYGFHGTLKAPFHLAPEYDEAALVAAVTAFANSCQPFELPALELRALGSFFALVPSAPVPDMNALARRAVLDLDRFRAPLSDADRARRNVHQLTPRQRVLLEAHGYPFVLEEFRFHMTLTGAMDADESAQLCHALAEAYARSSACAPVRVQDVALFVQHAPQTRFRLMRRFVLADATCMVA